MLYWLLNQWCQQARGPCYAGLAWEINTTLMCSHSEHWLPT
jgi:hypothetical protein